MIQISIAQPQDASAIQKLLRETWIDAYGSYLSPATLDEVYQRWQSIEFLTKQIENPDFYFPVAREENQIIGIATGRSVDGVTVVFRLYVHPHHQRQGAGQRLLEEMIIRYPENKKIQLHVEEQNEKGLAFYTKHGFQEIKREKERIVHEEVMQILMKKELPNFSW